MNKMEKFYQFAGVGIAVELPEGRGFEDARLLTPFAVPQGPGENRFRFTFCNELSAPDGMLLKLLPELRVYQSGDRTIRYLGFVQDTWEKAYCRVENSGFENQVEVRELAAPSRITAKTILNCIAAEHLVVQAGGVVFHSSYIEYQGKAILFTAPSGTGKSTQADLWEKYRGAEIINGDRSVIRWDGGVFACGIPFAGSSAICKNRTLPLAAIVYLQQAPVTSIRKMRGAEAFRRVWEGCSVNSWDKQDMTLATETVMRVLETVPVFELACTPDESAVLALEGVLKG